MLQYVNTVLVGGAQSATAKTMANAVAGDILMFDNTGSVIDTTAKAAAANEVKFGLVSDKVASYVKADGTTANIKVLSYSNLIDRGSIRTYNPFVFSAAKEDKVVISFAADFTPVIGNRYVLRIIYIDLYEHPGQFTHTYEVIAATTKVTDLIDRMTLQINKDTRRRVIATKTATSITLDALVKTDNEGKESINIYTQVNMEAVMYYTNPNATGFASKNKYPIAGLTIVKTSGTSGKGNAKLIRDREQAALSYKGITNRTWWPVIKPELNVDLSKSYDGFVLEFEPEHRTAEDGFRKTKQSVEIYAQNTPALATTMIGKLAKSFVDGVAVA